MKKKCIIYRIRVYKTPLLIKPPLQENSKKIQINRHFFAQKSTFWGYFEQKLDKFLSHFNKPPPQNPDFFIRRRRLIDADTVYAMVISPKMMANASWAEPHRKKVLQFYLHQSIVLYCKSL